MKSCGMEFAVGGCRTFGLTMFRSEVPCFQLRCDCGPWNGVIYCATTQDAISRLRSLAVAPLYEWRNAPVADRRYGLVAPPTYYVGYR